MNYGFQGSTDSSSEENDQEEEVKDYNSTKRPYECTFCKRGFTNAQALGGHMNIHRKDRAKAKQLSGTTSSVLSINKLGDDHDHDHHQLVNSTYLLPIPNKEPTRIYPVFEAQRNCHMYFQTPNFASSQRQYTHGCHESLLLQRFISDDLSGANLSLKIGSTNVDDVARMKDDKEELDLELRLGHYPYP